MAFKPEITVTLFPKKAQKFEPPIEETPVDYVRIAEEAASRLGKKLLVGGIVFSAVFVGMSTLGSLAVTALEARLNK